MPKVFVLEPDVKARAKLMKDIVIKEADDGQTIYDASDLNQYYGRFGFMVEDDGTQVPMFFIDGNGYVPISAEIKRNDEWQNIDLAGSKVDDNGIQIVFQ